MTKTEEVLTGNLSLKRIYEWRHNGWPDFLVLNKLTGKLLWIEVKAITQGKKDLIRPDQEAMFMFLEEHLGVEVLIAPNGEIEPYLIHWRAWPSLNVSRWEEHLAQEERWYTVLARFEEIDSKSASKQY